MRIGMVGLWYKPVVGGVENTMEILYEGLTKKGYEITIHTSLLDRANQLITEDISHVKRYKPFVWNKHILKTYAKMFKADLKGEDIVWCHNWGRGASDYNARKAHKLGIPVVLSAHDADYPASSKMGQVIKNFYDRRISRLILRYYDYIVIKTDYDRPFFRKMGMDNERIITIPSGIDDEPFKRRGTGVLDKYGLEREGYILYVGRLDWDKSVGDIIKAAQGLDMPVVIGGKGPETENLKRLSKELDVDARLLGFVSEEDKFGLMENAFCYVNPSRHEAFGLLPLEAYASGCPVIASKVGGVPFVFGENRVLFYKYGDIDELKEKLKTMQEDRVQYIPDMDYARTFMWNRTVEMYDDLFKKIGSKE